MCETPDTMEALFQYPKFLMTYESRTCNPLPMFNSGNGTAIHGTEGSILLTREQLHGDSRRQDSKLAAVTYEKDPEMGQMNVPHWKNFLECIKTRQKPTSDIETCVRSSTACLLANLSMRHGRPPGLGREELDGEAGTGAPVPEVTLPRSLEAGSVGGQTVRASCLFHVTAA